jgi:hypothetical protein
MNSVALYVFDPVSRVVKKLNDLTWKPEKRFVVRRKGDYYFVIGIY